MLIQTTNSEANKIVEAVMNRNHFLQVAIIDVISQITRVLAWDQLPKHTREKLQRSKEVLNVALYEYKE